MTGNESDPAKDPDKTVFDPDSVFGGDAADAEGTSDTGSDDIWGPFTGEAAPDHNTRVLESDAFGRAQPFLPESGETGDPFAGDQSPWSPSDEPGGRDPWGPPAEPSAHMEHEVPPPWEFESGGTPGPWSPPAGGGWQPGQPGSPAGDNGQQPWQPQQQPQPPQNDGFDPFGSQQPPGSAGDGGGIPSFDAPQPGTEVPNPFATADFGAPAESTPSPFDDEVGETPSFWPSGQHQDDPDADPDRTTDVLPKPSGQPGAADGDTGPFGRPGQPGGDAGPFGGRPDDDDATPFGQPWQPGDTGQPGGGPGPFGQPAQPDGGSGPFGSGQPDGSDAGPFGQPPRPGDTGPFGQPPQPGDSGQPGGDTGPFGRPGQPGDSDTGPFGQPPQPGDSGQPGSDTGPFGQPPQPGSDLLSPFDQAQADTGQPNPFEQPPQPGGGPPNPFAQQNPWSADAGQQAPQQQQAPRYDLSQFQQGYQGQQPPQPPPPQQQDPGQQFGYPQQQAPGGQQYPNMGPPLQMPPQQQAPLTSDNLSPQALLRPRKAPPSSGWRRAVFKVSGGVIDPGESSKEIQRQQMVSLVRTPVAGGHYRVAVLSLKGGVGKTTTTVGLGSTLASLRGDRIIAVDANPDRGTLSEKVRLETRANVRDLLANRDSIQRYSDVRQYTSQAASRLEVLASDPDPAISEAFSENDYRAVADVLEHYYSICLTDCGTGLLHSAMRGVLGLADQIVLVSSASVDGARSASATLDWLDAHDYGDLVQSGVVVMSAVRPQNKAVDLSRLEQHFSARCRALVRIPFDPHLEAGAEFVLDQLSAPTHDAYLELTAAVAAGFQYRLPR